MSCAAEAFPSSSKAFQVLAYLIQHRDRVVTKEELHTQLWPGEFVTESVLIGCIVKARQAVHDDGTAQRELNFQLMLGRALAVVKGFAAPDAGYAYARARELCHQLVDTGQLFAVLVGLREYSLNRGELHTARELAPACLPLAQRQHDAASLMRAHFGLGSILYFLG
jgi:hypothetical protein